MARAICESTEADELGSACILTARYETPRNSVTAEPAISKSVRDAFCDWNEGRWRLADGRAERTDEEPDLRLDADALGSAYLGGVSFAALREALRIEELRPGAAEQADALFRAALHPWCPEIF